MNFLMLIHTKKYILKNVGNQTVAVDFCSIFFYIMQVPIDIFWDIGLSFYNVINK